MVVFKSVIAILLLAIVGSINAGSQTAPSSLSITTTKETGGNIQIEFTTPSGESIKDVGQLKILRNPKSTLARERIAIHDGSLPADLLGTPGIRTTYQIQPGKSDEGEFRYTTGFVVSAREDLAAVDVRFLLFDIWGNHAVTLSTEVIEDIMKGGFSTQLGEWTPWSSLLPNV